MIAQPHIILAIHLIYQGGYVRNMLYVYLVQPFNNVHTNLRSSLIHIAEGGEDTHFDKSPVPEILKSEDKSTNES